MDLYDRSMCITRNAKLAFDTKSREANDRLYNSESCGNEPTTYGPVYMDFIDERTKCVRKMSRDVCPGFTGPFIGATEFDVFTKYNMRGTISCRKQHGTITWETDDMFDCNPCKNSKNKIQ